MRYGNKEDVVTDLTHPDTIPERPARGTTVDQPVIPPTPAAASDERPVVPRPRRPLDDLTLETPRTHPVAYAALALGTLALLLSLAGLFRGDGDGGFRQVKIGTNDCVIGHQAAADVLYCRTPTPPG
jgi:hypothetical protein